MNEEKIEIIFWIWRKVIYGIAIFEFILFNYYIPVTLESFLISLPAFIVVGYGAGICLLYLIPLDCVGID